MRFFPAGCWNIRGYLLCEMIRRRQGGPGRAEGKEGNDPFFIVERYDHWFYSRGQDKKADIHATRMEWRLITKNKDLAIKTAKAHID
jgi:hypothetical protein